MSSVSRWRDSGHLERAVTTAGGREAFDAAVAGMLDDHANRLASLPGVAMVTSYVTMKTLSADTALPAGRRRLERPAN
jgi:hypothetical protein